MEETITQDNGASVADVVEDNNTSVSVENTEMDASMSVTLDATPEAPAETPVALEMPKKFAEAEDPMQALLKSYSELEKGNSQAEPEATPEVEPEVTPEAEPTAEKSVVEKAQDDWAKQGGQLSDDQWDNIQKETGIPMDTLKAWETHVKDSMVANSKSNDQKIFEASGGEDHYNKMIEWAGSNLNDDQLTSLNAQLDNPQFSDLGVAALKGMYANSVGYEASIDPVASVDPTTLPEGEFLTEADFQAGMEHPDYGKNGRYDKEFDARSLRYMKRTGQL